MTVGTALAAARELLAGGDSPALDARRLLAALLERNSAWLFAHEDQRLPGPVTERFRLALARRAAGEPLAYILGAAGFYGRRFEVSSAVLVPRPESELLVELALAALGPPPREAVRLCDVGTGSGILAVTLAAEVPEATLTASDVSPEALVCAERNARAHGVAERVRFVLADALDQPGDAPPERFACIVANLPYVATDDLPPFPDSTAYEPRLALDGGRDGLDLYRKLLARAPQALAAGGTLLMEAGSGNAQALAELGRRAFSAAATVRVVRDYAGLERVVAVRAPGEGSGPGAKLGVV